MNWTEIRPLNGSQNDGFEELVCQLANKELIPDKKQFVRNGKPDAGVECYWVLNDDKEVAWQAKYFTTSFSNTQWGEIDSSVRTALDKHPKLTKYIIAFPINPPDARLDGQKSMREKWNERVSKWQGWAAQKSMSVEFVHWWESDIIERLQLPDNAGMFYFWFHQQEFTSDWFNHSNKKSIADLGVRYTPELNVELDIAKIFDGLFRDSRFYDLLYTSLDNLLIAGDKVLKYCKGLTTYHESISSNMSKLVNTFDIKNLNRNHLQIPIQQYCNIISDFSDCCDRIMNYYIEEEGKVQKELNEYRFYHKYGSEIHYVRGLQESLYTFSQFVNSATCKLANTPILLLEGDAGVGKSHLFADVVKNADEGSAILLLGQYFTSQDSPWTQIKRICDINCSEDEFLGALNAKAESEQRRIVLFIDAANEGNGKSFWKSYINGFITTISKYEWLGLAISVRSSYTKLLFPEDSVNRFIRYKHEGFGQKEGEAIHLYFKAYDVPLPDTPILQTEFQNPLFLKLFCIGQKNNRNRIGVSPIYHLDAIINNYISGIENQLAERLHYNASLNIVEKAINTFIGYMVVNNKAIITYEEAYLELDTICTKYHINNSLLEELISEGIFIKNIAYNGIEYVYFAYERLGDYLTAKHLLEKTSNIENAFVEGGELFNYVRDINACMQNQGLIDAFSILVPTLTRREFFECIPHVKDYYAIAESFIKSLLWRHIEQLSDEVRTYLMSINDRGLHQLFWNICLSISTIPNHAFNANFLHQHLSKFTLADRDRWWIPFLKFQWLYDSPTETLINWAWSFENISYISNESVKLASITLSWFLASTNRNLRDSSTKALICLLKRRTSVLIDVLRLFENVNDPYIYERLYAVAFGCAVRLENKQELTELSQYVYDTVFKEKEEVYPHILLRDYAREIIEYANYKGCALSFPIEEVRPPYHSILPKKFPSNEKIDAKYKLDYQAKDFKDYHYSQNSILHSMVTEYGRGTGSYGDFGRYVFQAGLSCFDVNYDGLSNYALKLIFEKYGYDKEKHGKFDREVGSSSWQNSGIHNERIGKKYQWLAYYELLARVSDNCQKHEDSFSDKIEPYNGPWNPYVRDIDPTILIHNTGDFHVVHPQYWWEVASEFNMDEDNKTWMTHKDDLPSPDRLIDISDDNGEEWLALEYHPEWDEEKHLGEEKYDSPKKRVWYQIRSYLVKEEDYQKVIDWIKGKNFRGRWMPEKTDWYELFNREYYWSPGFQEFNKRYIEETESSEEFQLNDNVTGSYIANCHVTTKAYFWEEEFDHSKEEAFYIIIPSKLIYYQMHLRHSDKEGEFVDADNNIICFDPSVYNNSFSALLIKKKPFLEFLKNNHLKIIWTLLSEKQIIGGHSFAANENPSPLDISGVYYMDDDYKVQGDFAIHSPEELMYRATQNEDDDIYEFDEIDEIDGLIKLAIKKKDNKNSEENK